MNKDLLTKEVNIMFNRKRLEEQYTTIEQLRLELNAAYEKIEKLENDNKRLQKQLEETESQLNKERAAKTAEQPANTKAPPVKATAKQPAKSKQATRKIKFYNGFELTEEQSKVVDLLENTSNNYFITGKAGSGKSTVLSYFREHTKKKCIAVVALTGAAAMNVGGQTIHSLFRMDFNPQDTWSKSKVECQPIKETMKAIEVLIINAC